MTSGTGPFHAQAGIIFTDALENVSHLGWAGGFDTAVAGSRCDSDREQQDDNLLSSAP